MAVWQLSRQSGFTVPLATHGEAFVPEHPAAREPGNCSPYQGTLSPAGKSMVAEEERTWETASNPAKKQGSDR